MNYPNPGPVPPGRDYPGYRRPVHRNTGLWISLAVALVIIVVLSAVVIIQLTGKKSETPPSATAAPPPSSTAQRSPQPAEAPPSPTMSCEGFTASVDENSQPGWHAAINHLGLAYAAPPDWKVAACGVRMGWAKPCPEGQCVVRDLGAVSTVPNPACPEQNLALAGVSQSKNPDINAALDEESNTVSVIYTQGGKVPSVEFTPVQHLTIGGRPAVQMVANVNDIETDACFDSSAIHSMVVTTVPNVEGSVVFVISLRKGVNATPKPDVIDAMVKTLRSPA